MSLNSIIRDSVFADIRAERDRQINTEGWDESHDDDHKDGEMAIAAGLYALNTGAVSSNAFSASLKRFWPWDWKWWKPKDPERDLIRAGALIAAELERLRRSKKGNS